MALYDDVVELTKTYMGPGQRNLWTGRLAGI